MESKYNEHSYKSVERNSNPLELIYTDIYDMKLTPSHGGKKYLLLLLRIALEMAVYLLNSKDEAKKCLDNVISKLKISVKKYKK